ncbi:hypothetical protein OXT66_05805 [Lentilactobacillus senioris]|uniref:hypothetical protein n=1 Tax=Lentilactobacillus senioris TaxID=931534 RepID=UPI002281407B|nr:hypothetical protein [Lentilactobacillus senioris]MCY9807064.1 hypothetical protein [Lentilactobacillus senioris]
MPIKIKDSTVYECYDSAKCEYGDSKWQVLLEAFTGEINDLADGTEMSANDILKVTDAILRGVNVELEEERYALCTRGSSDIAFIDDKGFVRTFLAISRHTQAEWDAAFSKTPRINKDAFEKVYEDD